MKLEIKWTHQIVLCWDFTRKLRYKAWHPSSYMADPSRIKNNLVFGLMLDVSRIKYFEYSELFFISDIYWKINTNVIISIQYGYIRMVVCELCTSYIVRNSMHNCLKKYFIISIHKMLYGLSYVFIQLKTIYW